MIKHTGLFPVCLIVFNSMIRKDVTSMKDDTTTLERLNRILQFGVLTIRQDYTDNRYIIQFDNEVDCSITAIDQNLQSAIESVDKNLEIAICQF